MGGLEREVSEGNVLFTFHFLSFKLIISIKAKLGFFYISL